jgi:hypothetical protein
VLIERLPAGLEVEGMRDILTKIVREHRFGIHLRRTSLRIAGSDGNSLSKRALTMRRRAKLFCVSRAFPSWTRSILTEIHLCHACSDQDLRMETPGQANATRTQADYCPQPLTSASQSAARGRNGLFSESSPRFALVVSGGDPEERRARKERLAAARMDRAEFDEMVLQGAKTLDTRPLDSPAMCATDHPIDILCRGRGVWGGLRACV